MSLDMTSFDAALKQIYTRDRIINQVYKDNPLYALMPKMTSFEGRNLPIVTIWGNPQGRSTSFTRAQARGAVTNAELDDFLLTRVKNYSLATVDGETMQASKSDMGAFLEAATVQIDGALDQLSRDLAITQYRSGYGEVGQIAAGSSVAGLTITLSNPDDVTNFEVQQELEAAATVSGALIANGSSGNGLIITGINRSTGVLTFGFNVNDATNGIPTIAAGYYLFNRGDHVASTLTKWAGLEAWIPASVPGGGDNFFGVNRSVDTRLSGQRLNGAGAPIEEVLIDGAVLVNREGGKLSHYFMDYEKFGELQKALGSKVEYINLEVEGQIGFRGIMLNTGRGMVRVVPDQNCPANRIFGLQMDMWKVYSLNEPVQILEQDGLMVLRQPNADGIEVRTGSYANMGCRAPGYNINIQV